MDPRLMMEIRQLAEQYCPTQGHHAAGWKAGFCAFADVVDHLHKQMTWPNVAQPVTSLSSSIWNDATTRRRNPYMSYLDQAIADHDAIRDAEIAERQRRAIQINHELHAERAFATDPYLLQNQLDILNGKYVKVNSAKYSHSSTYTIADDKAGF
jgi:hypothetical protein